MSEKCKYCGTQLFVAEIGSAWLRERDHTPHTTTRCLENQLAAMTTERDAYRKAKAENDERFQLEAAKLQAENARLREIVDKLPKIATGVPMIPGMPLWALEYMGGRKPENGFIWRLSSGHGWSRGGDGTLWATDQGGASAARLDQCYPTREEAVAAKEKA